MELTPEARARLVRTACIAAGAAGAAVVIVAGLAGELESPWLALAFAVAMVAAEYFPLHLTHRSDSEALRIEEAFLVPMAVLLSPVEALTALAFSTAVVHAGHHRGLLKGVFNVGMITATAGLGLAVASGVQSVAGSGRGALLGAVLGGLVFCAASAALVSGIIALAQDVSYRDVLLDGAAVRAATWVGSLSLGGLVLLAAEQSLVALGVALVPAVVLQFAYAGALGQWRERQSTEALYAAATRIHASVDSSTVRAQLVAATGQLLSAGAVHLVYDADTPVPAGALRVPIDDQSAVEVAERATGGRWSRDDTGRLQALAAVASGALANALLYEQLQAITRSLGEGVLALDAGGRITFVNPAGARLLAWRGSELIGRHIADAIDPAGTLTQRDGGRDWVHLPRLRAGETLRLDEYAVTRSDGSSLDVALTASPVVRDEQVVGAVIAMRDVTERKALERRMLHQAFHDQLTGLPNRALFLDRLEHAQARAVDSGTTQAILFVDLDRFKVINDSLGHRAGDDVLCTVGSRLVGALGFGDTVARFGGDEFTVLLEEVADVQDAIDVGERILQTLSLPMTAGDRSIVISASIGIALSGPGEIERDLVAAGDIAMYEAKSAGGGRCAVASSDADGAARAKLDLEMELRRAIAHGELVLDLQPVVRTSSQELYGFEALVRWRHPRLGMLPPAHFMPLAEETGLVLPLGEWVLQEACRTAKQWYGLHPESSAVMAVNLSARQFQDPGLCARVREVLDRTGLDPSRLTLEITETVVMEDTERTLTTLHALRALGVRLAIDDFGTGYSSLSYLKRFPVDIVKIDKSFVDGLADDSVDREIVAAVIRLARAVGMQTVAEGVEDAAQLEQLQLLGCSLVQGYLISRPQSVAHLSRRFGGSAVPAPRPADAGLETAITA